MVNVWLLVKKRMIKDNDKCETLLQWPRKTVLPEAPTCGVTDPGGKDQVKRKRSFGRDWPHQCSNIPIAFTVKHTQHEEF